MTKSDDDHYSEQEARKRMESAIHRAQKTPPQSHKDIAGKKGKSPKAQKPRINRHQGR